MKKKLVGILLAGGLSRRYGSPKAFAEINGRKFYEIVYDVLACHCDEVVIVTRQAFVRQFPDHYHVIIDKEPFVGSGPLAGIYSAMDAAGADHYAVLPCDMPLMNQAIMQKLISLHDCDVTAAASEGRLQPLVSVWSRGVKSVIKEALTNGQLKMTDVLDQVEVKQVDAQKLSASPKAFMNINTPEEDEALRQGK